MPNPAQRTLQILAWGLIALGLAIAIFALLTINSQQSLAGYGDTDAIDTIAGATLWLGLGSGIFGLGVFATFLALHATAITTALEQHAAAPHSPARTS